MKTSTLPAAFALLVAAVIPGAARLAASTGPATDRVAVTFVHPEKFTDVKDSSGDFENERGREHYLPALRDFLIKEASELLPAGQKLAVQFTDIDLAGEFEPGRGPESDHIRIVKGLYVPRLTLTFQLTDAQGKVLKAGERQLVDLAFQMRITGRFANDSLRYEKGMLDDWLREELPPRQG